MASGRRQSDRSGRKRDRDDERDRGGDSAGRRAPPRSRGRAGREGSEEVFDRRRDDDRTRREPARHHRRDSRKDRDRDRDRDRDDDAYDRDTHSPTHQRRRREAPDRARGRQRGPSQAHSRSRPRTYGGRSESESSDEGSDVDSLRGDKDRRQSRRQTQRPASSASAHASFAVREAEAEEDNNRWGREAYAAKPRGGSPDRARVARSGEGGGWSSRRQGGAVHLDTLLREGRARSARWWPVSPSTAASPSSSLPHRAGREEASHLHSAAPVVRPLHHVVLYGVERSVSAGHLRSLAEQLLAVRPARVTRPAKAAAATAVRAAEVDRLVKEAALHALGAPEERSAPPSLPTEGYLDAEPSVSAPALPDEEAAAAASSAAGVLLAPPQMARAVADGLYDAAGPGGMIVLGFDAREAAQSAVARLHGAVLNGLQLAATLC